MIGFRNLLLHDYASINLNLVYEFLQTKLPDFENFTKYIAKWLKKSKYDPLHTNHQDETFFHLVANLEVRVGSINPNIHYQKNQPQPTTY
jgi:hypothetical protein